MRQYVWDFPTRAFHWLLVALIGFAWWSAETDHMDWHLLAGVAACGLLIFRILWGVFGTDTARFAQFVKGPRAVWAYLRPGEGAPRVAPIGHNPLGGLSVVALLLVLAIQIGSGLFAVDIDGIESGQLSWLVDFDQGRLAASIHHTSFTVLQVLVVVHVLAILFYLVVRRNDLISPMIVGTRPGGDRDPVEVVKAPYWRLAIAVLIAGLATWWIAGGARF